MSRPIPGKILLFGEYALLEGGNALSIPYPRFSGILKYGFEDEASKKSNLHIQRFSEFIITNFSEYFDTSGLISAAFEREAFFDSNIPQGYGVGSSGALVAAIIHEFGKNLPGDLQSKKKLFGAIESHFHGKSSGLDVLVCFENAPIRIENSKLKIAGSIDQSLFDRFELIDTHELGLTTEMVAQFKAQGSRFKDEFRREYVTAGNLAIKAFLGGDENGLIPALQRLSEFTFQNMSWTIPDSFYAAWEKSLSDEAVIYKLCGSGGGGFVLKYSIS